MEENPDFPITALPKRGDPRDVLVLPQMQHFENITAQIGSSSFRRQIQLKKLFPSCHCLPVRGNIITRLQKLDCGEFSSLVLAGAGLQRVGLSERISRYFSTDEMIPAAGQGILAVQSRKNEDVSFLSCIHNKESEYAALAERAFVRTLDGGCSSPIAAYAQIEQAKKYGMTVIITDHHEIPYEEEPLAEPDPETGETSRRRYKIPPADVVIDPKQAGDTYPFQEICGAVVAFKLMQLLFAEFGFDGISTDLTSGKRSLLDELLDMKQIGISLTENGAMYPHASVCGLMFSHPASEYFSVGKIGEDQLEDYTRRRGKSIEEMRKFLAANLQ